MKSATTLVRTSRVPWVRLQLVGAFVDRCYPCLHPKIAVPFTDVLLQYSRCLPGPLRALCAVPTAALKKLVASATGPPGAVLLSDSAEPVSTNNSRRDDGTASRTHWPRRTDDDDFDAATVARAIVSETLSSDQKALLARWSVFPSSFSLDAAGAIAGLDKCAAEQVRVGVSPGGVPVSHPACQVQVESC